MTSGIRPVTNPGLKRLLEQKINLLSKPFGALGFLEELAIQAGLVLNSDHPRLHGPSLLIFAGDHGVVKEALPNHQEVYTYQTILDFLQGTEVINTLARQSPLQLKIVDAGVDHSFEGTLTYWLNHGTRLLNRKVGFGTNNFVEYPAMTTAETIKAIEMGMDCVEKEFILNCNVLGLSSLGRGGFSSSLALYCALLESTPGEVIVKEEHKIFATEIELVTKALRKHPITHDPLTILALYGGFEMAALTGAILRAAQLGQLLIIDDFNTSVAALVACKINSKSLDYCIFAQQNKLSVHQHLLGHIHKKAILNLEVGMGEGAGVLLAYPILQKAVDLLKEYNSPEEGF